MSANAVIRVRISLISVPSAEVSSLNL
jgi:hypothetical protein